MKSTTTSMATPARPTASIPLGMRTAVGALLVGGVATRVRICMYRAGLLREWGDGLAHLRTIALIPCHAVVKRHADQPGPEPLEPSCEE